LFWAEGGGYTIRDGGADNISVGTLPVKLVGTLKQGAFPHKLKANDPIIVWHCPERLATKGRSESGAKKPAAVCS